MKKLCLFLSLLAAGTSLSARPVEIILLRHAEKPADDKNPNLSARGQQRARAFPSFLTTSPVLISNGLPSAIFAAAPTARGHSRRAGETIAPTARELHLPVQMPFVATDYAILARDVLTNRTFNGKTVVICWVHDYIPQLAHEFGIHHPPGWSGDTFDRVWVITFPGDRAVLQNLPQHLLKGDSAI